MASLSLTWICLAVCHSVRAKNYPSNAVAEPAAAESILSGASCGCLDCCGDSCCDQGNRGPRVLGLLQSDPCFDRFISPIAGVTGTNVVSSIVGVKWKPSDNFEIGSGFEFPLTNRTDILRNRL